MNEISVTELDRLSKIEPKRIFSPWNNIPMEWILAIVKNPKAEHWRFENDLGSLCIALRCYTRILFFIATGRKE